MASRPGIFRRIAGAVRNAFRRATGREPVPPPGAPPEPPEAPPAAPPEAPPPPEPPEAPPEAPEPEPGLSDEEREQIEEAEREPGRVYGNPDQISPENWRGVFPTRQPILTDFQRNVPQGIWALVFEPDEDGWVLYVGDSP